MENSRGCTAIGSGPGRGCLGLLRSDEVDADTGGYWRDVLWSYGTVDVGTAELGWCEREEQSHLVMAVLVCAHLAAAEAAVSSCGRS